MNGHNKTTLILLSEWKKNMMRAFIKASVINSSCGRQKGLSMMTRYARSYSLQKGPSLEDSVE